MRTLLRLLASAAYAVALSGGLLAAPFAYISNSGSNDVSVVDTATGSLVARITAIGSRNDAASPDEVRP